MTAIEPRRNIEWTRKRLHPWLAIVLHTTPYACCINILAMAVDIRHSFLNGTSFVDNLYLILRILLWQNGAYVLIYPVDNFRGKCLTGKSLVGIDYNLLCL